MGHVKLAVPLVGQTQSMSCWYASACMVNYYFEAGPRLGLPKVKEANLGVNNNQIEQLAKVEGLKNLGSSTHEFSAASLMDHLRKYGPIFAPGTYFGKRHVIVVTGASDDSGGTVYYNDPDYEDSGQEDDVSWFNTNRARGLLYVKDMSSSDVQRYHSFVN